MMLGRERLSPLQGLPLPDSAANAHSRRLEARICQEIQACGAVSFRRYMEMALYEPGLGYYSAGAEKIGRAGDYVTAPEISTLYSRCVARQCGQILQQAEASTILEIGAGSGAMCCDIMLALEEQSALPVRYQILETSADLRQRQYQFVTEKAAHLIDRIEWLDGLPEHGFSGVILANEVVDAMPVHRLRLEENGIMEMHVDHAGDGFFWVQRPAPAALVKETSRRLADQRELLVAGYCTEISMDLTVWVSALAHILHRGVLLVIDYGYPRAEYYHPRRHQGTLRCFYRQQLHTDVFRYPGLQDITASVDFTLLAEAGVAAGLEVLGFNSQADFLIGCGIHEDMRRSGPGGELARLQTAQQGKYLMLPQFMGEVFKVIALGRDVSGPIAGFSSRDRSAAL